MADTSLQAESSYGKYNWSAQPAGVQANWKDFVSRWINNVDGAGKTLLGLTVTPTYIPGASSHKLPRVKEASGDLPFSNLRECNFPSDLSFEANLPLL